MLCSVLDDVKHSKRQDVLLSVQKDPSQIQYDYSPPLLPGAHDASLQGSGRLHSRHSYRTLSLIPVSAILYTIGCGGPIDSEDITTAAGPGLAVIGLFVFPLLCTIPYAAILAELCGSFPEDGGYVVWVLNGFGPFWAFQTGYWGWLSGILNNALLPGQLIDIITEHNNIEITSKSALYLLKALMATIFTIPSLCGSYNFGRICVVYLIVILFGASVYSIWSLTGLDLDHVSSLGDFRRSYNRTSEDLYSKGPIDIQWCEYLNSLYWNFDGLLNGSLFAGQVKDAAYVYPRAYLYFVLLTLATYLIPLLCTLLNTNILFWSSLEDGGYTAAAFTMGGSILGHWTFILSCISTCGLYLTSVYANSCEISGMADYQILPAVFSKRLHFFHGSPLYAILLTLAATLLVLAIDCDNALALTNATSAVTGISVVLTAIKLRYRLPYIPRPVKVPGPPWMIGVFALGRVAIMVFVVIDACKVMMTGVWIAGVVVTGIVLGLYFKRQYEL